MGTEVKAEISLARLIAEYESACEAYVKSLKTLPIPQGILLALDRAQAAVSVRLRRESSGMVFHRGALYHFDGLGRLRTTGGVRTVDEIDRETGAIGTEAGRARG